MMRALNLRRKVHLVPTMRKSQPIHANFVHIPRDEAYEMSIQDPTKFWGLQASKIDWFKPFDHVLQQDEYGYGKWFVGGELNTCYNALDRHIARGRGDQPAIIYDSPVTNTIRHFTYNEVLDEVTTMAAYLRSLGVNKGDKVVIYLPNIPQAAFAMLACARLGAVHSVVFGGFAAHELAVRIKDCKPKVVLSASCGIDGNKIIDYKTLLDAALNIVAPDHVVQHTVILQRPQAIAPLQPGRDVTWEDALNTVRSWPVQQRQVFCTPVKSEDPLYILYTSGTTGAPKGVQRDNGGHAVALAHSMDVVYGVSPGEVMWAASDVGWVVGHSYGTYGPLLAGATSLMYEGKPVGTPDAANFWRTLARHKVNVFFTAPTAIRAMKKLDAQGTMAQSFDLSSLRTIHLAGEHADKDTLVWLEHATATDSRTNNHHNHNYNHTTDNKGHHNNASKGIPVRDHWWQTETGWPIAADQLDAHRHTRHLSNMTLHGSTYLPCPGYNLQLFDLSAQEHQDNHHTNNSNKTTTTNTTTNTKSNTNEDSHTNQHRRVTAPHTQAQIFLKLPLPPGCLTTLFNAPDRFRAAYLSTLPGYYDTGDAGYVDEAGNVYVMARTDDVLNVAGHRLSSGALEEAVCLHEDVAEAAVVGVKDAFKGQVPLGLVVLNDGVCRSQHSRIVEAIVQNVRDRIGPVASFKDVAIVSRLPKTRSGKTLRATLRQMANHEKVKIPATVEDVTVIAEIQAVIDKYLARSSHHPQK